TRSAAPGSWNSFAVRERLQKIARRHLEVLALLTRQLRIAFQLLPRFGDLFPHHGFIPRHHDYVGDGVDRAAMVEHAAEIAEVSGLMSAKEIMTQDKRIEKSTDPLRGSCRRSEERIEASRDLRLKGIDHA